MRRGGWGGGEGHRETRDEIFQVFQLGWTFGFHGNRLSWQVAIREVFLLTPLIIGERSWERGSSLAYEILLIVPGPHT